ncbi:MULTISPECIES: hypothetical protein [Streptomyces]|uniref:PknH-like extracellular domain-containing protein n=2 Tax=Streptomyces TaxID=1883 RepID=A0ABV9IQ35_9ACTN
MTRRILLASALLSVGLTGCATLGLEHPPVAVPPEPTVQPSTGRPPAPTASPVLTQAQAQAALVTDTDLGAPWTPTRGAATWRDGLLKARTSVAGCQKLLDALYTDELFGAPARAVTALDDPDTSAQLRYQLTDRRPAHVDRTLAWLKSLPRSCARFTATAGEDTVEDVQVSELPLPEVGDARQGLRVTLTLWATAEKNPGGDPTVLALDVAAVRAGQDAFALTNGAVGDVPNEATQAAVQLGVRRLADVRRQGRVQV